jgi:acetolactate synthase-1/2/3 large subunit
MASEQVRSLVQGLHAAGVQKIFGMPGGGPNLDLIGRAEELGIDFVLAHGENAACIMASSYGRLTRTPGVAVVTRGPGLTSSGNGLAQARWTGSRCCSSATWCPRRRPAGSPTSVWIKWPRPPH